MPTPVTGTAVSVADLMTALSSFATTGLGWTQSYVSTDRLFLTSLIGGVQSAMSFRWDQAGTPANLGIYQARAFTSSSDAPGNHTDDSGQGIITGTNATLATGRHAPLINGSMDYWFFGLSNSRYIHAVVKVAATDYVHFGFGNLSKLGQWTGGEYSYGHHYNSSDQHGAAIDLHSSYLLDGLADAASGGLDSLGGAAFRASVHMEFVPGQVTTSKWAVIGNFATTGAQADRAGGTRNKVYGGFRAGMTARAFGRWGSDTHVGLLPLYPIALVARTSGTTEDLTLIGSMRDVQGASMQFFNAGDVLVTGGESWMLFPTRRKGGDGAAAGTTYYSGIAYKVS